MYEVINETFVDLLVMILILSQSVYESTTEEVMDWLSRFGARFLRVNDDDLDRNANFSAVLEQGVCELRIDCAGDLSLKLPQGPDQERVRVVWLRRWFSRERRDNIMPMIDLDSPSSHNVEYVVRRHLDSEFRALSSLFFSRFSDAYWLSPLDARICNDKLLVLQRAAESGLLTPATLITNTREDLARFSSRVGEVITKPLSEAQIIHSDGSLFFMYTACLDKSRIDALPEHFPVSLFQEKILKEYEVRVFFLEGECYSMAIFSQGDPLTREDFRCYNQERPNRYVPYVLSQGTANAIGILMRSLGLRTGSVDLIHTPDGHDVFLEVNPAGQFGFVSKACNYPLERRVAELLVRRDRYDQT